MASLLVKPCEPVGALGGLFDALSLLFIENRTAEYGVPRAACLGGRAADSARSRSPALLGGASRKGPCNRLFSYISLQGHVLCKM